MNSDLWASIRGFSSSVYDHDHEDRDVDGYDDDDDEEGDDDHDDDGEDDDGDGDDDDDGDGDDDDDDDDEPWVNFTAEEWRDYQAYHRRRQRESGYGHSTASSSQR